MKIHELLEQDPNTPSIQIISRLSKPHWGCCTAQVKKIFVCCLEKEVPPGNCLCCCKQSTGNRDVAAADMFRKAY